MGQDYKHWVDSNEEKRIFTLVWGVPRNILSDNSQENSRQARMIDKRESKYKKSIEEISGIRTVQFPYVPGDESPTRGDRLYINGWHYRVYELPLDNPELCKLEKALKDKHAEPLVSNFWLSKAIDAFRVN